MMHKQFSDIVRRLTALGACLETVSNGTLLSEENVSALLDADLRIFTFSFDGIRPATYEHIRRRSEFRKTIDSITRFRQRFGQRDTFFAVNTTMMRSNMAEIPEIIDFWDKADFHLIRFLSMVVRANDPALIRESLFPVRSDYLTLLEAAAKDIIFNNRRVTLLVPPQINGGLIASRNPAARIVPDPRVEHQIGLWPGMSVDCKSPWTFAKILNNGDVQLCYKFTVGNLREDSLEGIWFGERANAARAAVLADTRHCASCDYYRLCLKSRDIDAHDIASYFDVGHQPGIRNINFDTGELQLEHVDTPILVETVKDCNIVRYRGQYIVCPHELGPMDLSAVDLSIIAGLRIEPTLHAARSWCAHRSLTSATAEDQRPGPALGAGSQ